MKIPLMTLGAAIALAPAVQVSAQDTLPPLPTLEVSTMLFLMLGASDSADPIDINAFDVDFGNDAAANATAEAIDEMLEGK